jgi:hypothetical protein
MTRKSSERQKIAIATKQVIVLSLLACLAICGALTLLSSRQDVAGLLYFLAVALGIAAFRVSDGRSLIILSGYQGAAIAFVGILAFSEVSKSVPAAAAAKQFALVLLAGSLLTVWREHVSNPNWNLLHTKVTVVIATLTMAAPFMLQLLGLLEHWRDGISDITAILAGVTFGSLFDRSDEAAKPRNRGHRS